MEQLLKNKTFLQMAASAAVAFLFVNFYLKNKVVEAESGFNMVGIYVAARDIPPRTVVRADYLSVRRVPINYMEPGAFMAKIPEQDIQRVQGKVSMVAIPEGTQVTQSQLADPSPNTSGVAPLVPVGKRGYLLRLGNLDVAELILPGDHIDIMATFTQRDRDNNTARATHTILQNTLVLAVGRELRKPNEDVTKKKEGAEAVVLTLALDSLEAERLTLAQIESQGEISVVVRPHGESEVKPIPGANAGNLLDNQ